MINDDADEIGDRVPISEWASLNGYTYRTATTMYERGKLATAVKVKNRLYVMPDDSPIAMPSNARSDKTTHVCALCGREFVGGHSAKYCKSCKQKLAKAANDKRKSDTYSAIVRHIGDSDKCGVCGSMYIVRTPGQKYCCKACADDAHKRGQKHDDANMSAEYRSNRNAKRRASYEQWHGHTSNDKYTYGLERLMRERGLCIADIGRIADVTRGTAGTWVHCTQRPRTPKVKMLCDALGCNERQLFTR